MPKKRVFIVDDIEQTLLVSRIVVEKAFEDLGIEAEVDTFAGGAAARDQWPRKRPDVVFLDLAMPYPDGMEILRWWNEIRELQDTRVVVVSYKDENKSAVENLNAAFWLKSEDYNDLLRNCRVLFQSLPAYRKPYSEHLVQIHLTPGSPTRISVSGNVPRTDRSNDAWMSRVLEKNAEIDLFFNSGAWYQPLQGRGYDLYREIFVDQVADTYSEARLNAQSPENVKMRFIGQLETVKAGFELLFDRPKQANGDFMVLRHPIATQFDGLRPAFDALGRDKLNEAKERGREVRFLLVAANLEGMLPSLSADAEVTALACEIPKWFRRKGIEAKVEVVLSEDASIEHLQELSKHEQFDVLHFAGHATDQDDQQNEAGLYVWKGAGAERKQYLMSLPELEGLIKRMRISAAFLNCCRGGVERDAFYLNHSRLLGIAHAALTAGAASVLCYRSSVSDSSAPAFALDFYKNLADEGEMDIALHATRRAAYERAPNDRIWLSAMLISQTA